MSQYSYAPAAPYGQPSYPPQYASYPAEPQQQYGYATPVTTEPYEAYPMGEQPPPYVQPVVVVTNAPRNTPPGFQGTSSNVPKEYESKFHDVWATILFILWNVGVVVLMALPVNVGSIGPIFGGTPRDILLALLVFAAVGFALGFLYLVLIRTIPRFLIISCIILTMLGLIAFTAYTFYFVSILSGIFMALIVLLFAWMFYAFWSRIPFACIMMKTVAEVIFIYPSALLGSFLGFAAIFGYTVAVLYAAMKISVMPSLSGGAQIALYIFLIAFPLYWTTQVFKNVVHVATSGLFASYYFSYGTTSMPSYPYIRSMGRALTYSFGPICFGSLIVAAIQLVRSLLRSLAGRNNWLACCCDCILGYIEWIVRYFNHYAYTEVAIYGKSYVQAAKSVWNLFKRAGIDAIINDNLVGVVGNVFVFVGSIIGFGVGYLWNFVMFTDHSYRWYFAGLGFLICWLVMILFTEVVESGNSATFVCLAEDPNAIRANKPALFDAIMETYPGIRFR